MYTKKIISIFYNVSGQLISRTEEELLRAVYALTNCFRRNIPAHMFHTY